MKTFIIMALVSFSCSSFIDDEFQSIDPELRPYYDTFIEEAQVRGYDFSARSIMVHFKNHDNDALGITHSPRDGFIQISIDPDLWKDQSAIGKELVMLHEFGHGFLHKDHVVGCTIMNPALVKCMQRKYVSDRSLMLDELIN